MWEGVEEERMVTQDFMRESKADTCTNDIYPHYTHTHTHTHTGENLEVIAKQMQSLESEAIVWQESTPPQLDSTTTIGMESGDSSAAYPPHDGHMTSTPGSDDGHMTSPQVQVGGACNDSASFPDLPNIQFLTTYNRAS